MILLFFLFISFLFGAVIGSFTNCFIWRLHEKETLWDRSYCPKCRKKIAWFDNIPILSFFLLRGSCRRCKKKISWQYPLAEFSTACLFALSFYLVAGKFAPGGFGYYDIFWLSDSRFILSLAKDWLIIFVASVIFIYDVRWYLIPDQVVIPACLIVFLLNIFLGFSWPILLLSALLGGGFFFLQFVVSKGRWIGGGDIRLGILLGCATGQLSLFILALLMTYCLGSVIGLFLVAIGKDHWGSKVPLGAFLAPALLVTLFYGQQIVTWYQKFFY